MEDRVYLKVNTYSSSGTWSPGNIAAAGEAKTYSFAAIPGKTYTIAWDDSYQGSRAYTCDIYVAAYRQNLSTAYCGNTDSGYTSPAAITAQENIVYIRGCGYMPARPGLSP